MRESNIEKILWAVCVVVALSSVSLQMSCSYGERGSLTVYCVNATSALFKHVSYRFDHLDETLKCVNCSLNVIDSGAFDISGNQIKVLDIRNSSITRINYKAFIGLIFTEKILLSNNPIASIFPGAFIGVRKVSYLELENAVSNLDDHVFEELRILKVLILSRNTLSKLSDETFDGLINLGILDLSFNKLVTISNRTFVPLVSLRSLNLQNNLITVIKGNEFNSLRKLLLLNLENNLLTNFTMDIDIDNNLRILNLGNNRLSSDGIKIGAFQNLNELEELYLGHNLFTKIPAKFFQGLYRLRILDLSNNLLKDFTTGTFSGLPHLLTLNVSGNILESARVSGQLLLHSLHTLDLSDNHITKFDYIDFISRMPRITTIYLYNNYLPCETINELEILFNEDHQRFLVSTNYSAAGACKATDLTAKDIIAKLVEEEYQTENTSAGSTAWFILLVIVVHLVAILFYVQFFVLNSAGSYRFQIVRRHPVNS